MQPSHQLLLMRKHMPSHIFTRLGLWEESIESNINSASSAVCYAEAVEMDGHWDNEIHAMDYLVYAYLQKGDNENANLQYEYWQTIHKVNSESGTPYNFGAIPARIALENKQWAKAAELNIHDSEYQWEKIPMGEVFNTFYPSTGSIPDGKY